MNSPAHTIQRVGIRTIELLDIHCFTYDQRHCLLPDLTTVLGGCGGWILDRRTVSSTSMEFRVEIQLRAVLDLYAAILSTGLELTRSGHEVLTELCTRRKHMRITAELGQVVVIRLEIRFLEDIMLHSLLASGPNAA